MGRSPLAVAPARAAGNDRDGGEARALDLASLAVRWREERSLGWTGQPEESRWAPLRMEEILKEK
jgi:hypothetical protein